MSEDGNDEYHWRETYFILFDQQHRPTLTQVESTLGQLDEHYELTRLTANDDGLFDSATVTSPTDNVALEITFESGETVIEQGTELAKQLQGEAEGDQLAQLLRADARLDVMHLEKVNSDPYAEEDDMDDMFDPSCLLLVVDALVVLTEGLPVDPASGAILP